MNAQASTVLMTADVVGGVFPYSLDLARALAAHDVNVVLYTMGAEASKEQRAAAFACGNVEMIERTWKLEWMQDPWCDVEQSGRELLDIARERSPDVIHLNGYAHARLDWRRPVLVVGHSCVLSWWRAVKGGCAPAEWNVYRDRVREGLRAADFVVAPTKAMLDDLRRFYGPLPPCSVVPNGSGGGFHAGQKQAWIVASGRLWDEGKNVAAVREAAARLSWPVYAAGSGDCPGSENFFPIGFQPRREMARWFAAASIYVHPALYEPFGLTVLEAAKSACALVLADIPSLRENWGGAAEFVDPRDREQLVSTLRMLIHDDDRREDLQRKAYIRALPFTAERMAQGYVNVYEQVLAGHRRLACAS
jgi:glycosyltransferase involved in cell wall biosynthesis